MRYWIALALLLCSGVPAFPAEKGATTRETAVKKALEFLKNSQEKDGSWKLARFGKSNTAATGLSVLAFLSAGHVPGKGPYRACLDKGIRWVLKAQRKDGLLGEAGYIEMYQHGICTLMLAEAAVVTTDKELGNSIRAHLVKAVQLIERAQRKPNKQSAWRNSHQGGWRYRLAGYDSDLSVTGWQFLALQAARKAECKVPDAVLDWGLAYVKRCYRAGTGEFGYQPSYGPTTCCTAIGILARELTRQGKDHPPEALKAGLFLVKRLPRWSDNHLFVSLFFGSQAMFHLEGNFWKVYRPALHKLLLAQQKTNGSWLGQGEGAYGPAFSTAVAVLALTVEERRLSTLKRPVKKANGKTEDKRR